MRNTTPKVLEMQCQYDATRTNQSTSGSFKPTTNLRVMVTPPVRERIMRRFFRLQHSIRTIARGERMAESVIEQLAREQYWAAHSDDTGPLFPGGAVSPRRFGSGLLDVLGKRRVA